MSSAVAGADKEAPTTTFTANAVVAVSVVAAVWSAIAIAYRSDMYDWEAVPASSALLTGALAALLWRPSVKFVPLRAAAILVCAQGFQSSGLPILTRPKLDDLLYNPTPGAFTSAVEATALFSFAFLLAVAACLSVLSRPLPVRQSVSDGSASEAPREVSLWAGVALASVTVAASVLGSAGAGAFGALGTLPLIVFNEGWMIPMAAAAALSGSTTNRLILFISLVTATAMAAWTTMLGALMLPMRSVLLTLILLRRRGVALVAVAATGLFVIVNPAKAIVRNEAAAHGPASTFAESAERWQRALLATWTGESDVNENLDRSTRRFDYNSAGAAVFAAVPMLSPYKMGDTYLEIPYMLIPRAIMPGKENTKDFRARLTVEIGIQTADTTDQTAVALPAPAEAFWNFGWLGVGAVGAILGLACGLLYRLAPAEPVTGMAFVVLITTTIGTFNDLLFTIVPNFAFILIARVLIPYLTRSRRKAQSEPRGARRAPSSQERRELAEPS